MQNTATSCTLNTPHKLETLACAYIVGVLTLLDTVQLPLNDSAAHVHSGAGVQHYVLQCRIHAY